MDIRTKRALTRSLSDKIRRRICSSCRHGLQHATIEVLVSEEAAAVSYICPTCDFHAGGMVQLSARIKREVLSGIIPEAISFDEVDLVRNVLANWHGSLTELIA
jgi:hypothetical protein